MYNIPVVGGVLQHLLPGFTTVTDSSRTYFWTTLAWNTNAAVTMVNDIQAANFTQLANDLVTLINTSCDSTCTGGGENPPSIFPIPDSAADPVMVVYNNDLQLFARDTGTGHLISAWCAACDGSDWHFGDLGGIIVGAPAVASYNGQLQVIADGSDGQTLYHRWFENGFGWFDWQAIGCCGADPATTVYNNDLQLFARDNGTGHLISAWCAACDGSDWHFGDLGGVITGRPDASVYGGQLQVLADGSDGQTLFHKWYDNGFGWHDWQAIRGPADEPTGLAYGNGFRVMAHATDTGHVVHPSCALCDGSDWLFQDLG